ncbi:MAG: hypothetical protein LBT26_06600 [Clostridiales Family XIII bacterium]|jgi:hypothetical protein|nr:hypothetical protein [Clostridiales Family XIII bacterium]
MKNKTKNKTNGGNGTRGMKRRAWARLLSFVLVLGLVCGTGTGAFAAGLPTSQPTDTGAFPGAPAPADGTGAAAFAAAGENPDVLQLLGESPAEDAVFQIRADNPPEAPRTYMEIPDGLELHRIGRGV